MRDDSTVMAITEPLEQPRRGRMVRNFLHLGVGQVATTALTVLLSAAIARTLGAADFGLLYFVTAIATFAYVFVDWGHGPYIVREVARHPSRAGTLIGTVLIVRAATAVVVCAIVVAITRMLGYDLRTCLLAAALICAWLPQYLGLSFTWIFRGRERMDRDALLNVVLKFATLVASLACLALGGRLVALVLVPAVGGILTLVLAIVFYRRLGLPPINATSAVALELARDGAPMLAMSLAVAVQPYFDANILYRLASPGVVGWYGASWNIAGTLVAPAMIMGATMYPRLSRSASDPAEFKEALRAAFRPLLFVAVLGAAGAFLFADTAIGIIYSTQKFGPAATILKAFAPALLLLYVDMMLSYAIFAVGRAGQLAAAKVAAVIVTTGLELILIPLCQARFGNGGIGIMLAMAAGELLMVVAAMILIRDAIDWHMMSDLLRGLASGVVTVVLMRMLPPLSPWIGIPACVAVFASVALLVGLVNRSDLALLTASLRNRAANAGDASSAASPAISAPAVDPFSDR
jgi:PST family polysaccharide transporter